MALNSFNGVQVSWRLLGLPVGSRLDSVERSAARALEAYENLRATALSKQRKQGLVVSNGNVRLREPSDVLLRDRLQQAFQPAIATI